MEQSPYIPGRESCTTARRLRQRWHALGAGPRRTCHEGPRALIGEDNLHNGKREHIGFAVRNLRLLRPGRMRTSRQMTTLELINLDQMRCAAAPPRRTSQRVADLISPAAHNALDPPERSSIVFDFRTHAFEKCLFGAGAPGFTAIRL